jgi:hypothetical protein
VYAEGSGFGILPFVHGGREDLVLVGSTLEEFLAKSEQGKWFD